MSKIKSKPVSKSPSRHNRRSTDKTEEKTALTSKPSNYAVAPPTKRSSSHNLKKKPSKLCITPIAVKTPSSNKSHEDNKMKKTKSEIKDGMPIAAATKEMTSGPPCQKSSTTPAAAAEPLAPVKKPVEKWIGEEVALMWAQRLEKLEMIPEYREIEAIRKEEERCKIWAANMSRNRHPEYKCYDDNRVIVQMAKTDYINATRINIPNFTRPAFLVQMPNLQLADAIEEFWRMIFTEQCSSAHIIVQDGEIDQDLGKLFGLKTNDFFYVNGFFVNTRKVEKIEENMSTYVVELLPEGCSNSLMCQVYLHSYWKPQGAPNKFHAPMKGAQLIAKSDIENNPVAIVSVRGAGRNASLLTLAVVVSFFGKGVEPKIKEIVRTIREQRPMAVDSFAQYITLYMSTSWYLGAKMGDLHDMKNRTKAFRDKCCNEKSKLGTIDEPTREVSKDT